MAMQASLAWRQSLAAARANFLPGLVLQCTALALVLAYYFHPGTHAALDALAERKLRYGFGFSLISTALFGGLIPFLYMRLHPATRAATPLSHGLFFLLFWAYKGVEVDAFYRAQGWLFGNEPTAQTILSKTLFDELVYSPFWALPWAALIFHWKETGFSFAAMRRLDLWAFLKEALPKNLIGAWGVWFPAVAIIYSLPAQLQVPLFNIVLCFYSLLLAALTRKKE